MVLGTALFGGFLLSLQALHYLCSSVVCIVCPSMATHPVTYSRELGLRVCYISCKHCSRMIHFMVSTPSSWGGGDWQWVLLTKSIALRLSSHQIYMPDKHSEIRTLDDPRVGSIYSLKTCCKYMYSMPYWTLYIHVNLFFQQSYITNFKILILIIDSVSVALLLGFYGYGDFHQVMKVLKFSLLCGSSCSEIRDQTCSQGPAKLFIACGAIW